MKTKSDFVLRQVAQSWMVLPVAAQSQTFDGVLNLTESGAILWQQLEKGCQVEDLVDALTREYDVTAEKARADAIQFVEKLKQLGCLEND